MNPAIKRWAKKIRKSARNHPQWKLLTLELSNSFDGNFTRKEIDRAINWLFDTYDPNTLAPPELFTGDEWNEPKLPNPFWSLTTIDDHGNVLDVFLTDSDDLERLQDFLLRDPTKELQDEKLNSLWKSIKRQQPNQENLPYFVYFSFVVNEENVELQARKILKQHPQYKMIEKIFHQSLSTQNFLEALYRKLQLKVEVIIDLLVRYNSKLVAEKAIWMNFCIHLKISFDQVPSIYSFEALNLDWSEVEANNYFEDLNKFKHLKKLHLYCYSRHLFPDPRCLFTNIHEVTIRGRANITPGIGQLLALHELTLNDLRLEQLPDELFALLHLKILRLNKNLLTSLPSISPGNTLRRLELGFNRISTLPDTFSNLTKLEELTLHHNELQHLTHIGRLEHLKRLDVSNNKLKEIGSEISHLKDLEEINCTCNNIVAVSDEIVNLKNLKIFNLHFNPIPESRIQWLRANMPQTQIIHYG